MIITINPLNVHPLYKKTFYDFLNNTRHCLLEAGKNYHDLGEVDSDGDTDDDTDDDTDQNMYQARLKGKMYTVMRRLPGCELLEILIKDQEADVSLKLTTLQRLKLSIALLEALQEQVHDKGLIHLDIKPENILVVLKPYSIIVNIIDFNLSRKSDDKNDSLHPGTPGYAAPECYRVVLTDECADIYAMGRVIGLVWSANKQLVFTYDSIYESLKISAANHKIDSGTNSNASVQIISNITATKSMSIIYQNTSLVLSFMQQRALRGNCKSAFECTSDKSIFFNNMLTY